MRARLPDPVAGLVMFTLKQGWSALFGGMMLLGLIVTDQIWSDSWSITRYDGLLLYAIALQVVFLLLRLESWREVQVIFLFHLTGTVMELFKVNAGSWAYPEPALTKLAGVPLFSGFMYAAVGSYMARVMRVFEMRFSPYPPYWQSALLAVLIYANFFSHHLIPDMRLGLMAATVLLFWRTRISFDVAGRRYWMPMPVAGVLSAFFLWVAENVGTNTGTWLYAGQTHLDLVSLSKMGSWYLLLYVSFATVTLVFRDPLDIPARS